MGDWACSLCLASVTRMRRAGASPLRPFSLFTPGIGYYRRMASFYVFESIAPDALNLSDRNPRKGDVPKIKASLVASEMYSAITVNRGTLTARPWEVVKGNHTLTAIRELRAEFPDDPRWAEVPCRVIDVDDACAERILGADNKFGLLGGFDDKQLASLVTGFDAGFASAVGFTAKEQSNFAALLATDVTIPDMDPTPAPEPTPQPEGPKAHTITLKLMGAQASWAREGLDSMRDELGLENDAAAVLHLLGEYYGEKPPEIDATA